MKKVKKDHLNYCIIIVILFLSSCYTVIEKDESREDVRNITNNTSLDSLNFLINSTACDTVITLERTGCHGSCPIFKLALLSNGIMYFEGKHYVKRLGLHDTLFNKTYLLELVSIIYKSGFLKLKDSYDMSNCSGYFDLPGLIISIKTTDNYKRVSFYLGCTDYEEEGMLISNLAKKIEDISNIKKWIQ